jgi:hypothetical protein
MLARFVSVVFAVWLFVFAEQVTAVRDVLCLSHKPKSNRSESAVRIATEPLLLPRVLCSLSPLVPLCVAVIRRDLTRSITLSLKLGGVASGRLQDNNFFIVILVILHTKPKMDVLLNELQAGRGCRYGNRN